MENPRRRFCFVLAERLGYTVKELTSKMDVTELTEWMAEYNIRYRESKQRNLRAKGVDKVDFKNMDGEAAKDSLLAMLQESGAKVRYGKKRKPNKR